jgi:hypothetical protein
MKPEPQTATKYQERNVAEDAGRGVILQAGYIGDIGAIPRLPRVAA